MSSSFGADLLYYIAATGAMGLCLALFALATRQHRFNMIFNGAAHRASNTSVRKALLLILFVSSLIVWAFFSWQMIQHIGAL